MVNFWASWYHPAGAGVIELHSPWWISGYRDDDATICAAVRADSEDAAKDMILNAYDTRPQVLEWRFVEERPPEWSPFSDRFRRAHWMQWD